MVTKDVEGDDHVLFKITIFGEWWKSQRISVRTDDHL